MRWLLIKLFSSIFILTIYISANQYDDGRKICEAYWNTKYVNFHMYRKNYLYGTSYCNGGENCEGWNMTNKIRKCTQKHGFNPNNDFYKDSVLAP
jgi:hypothetical protein